MSKSTKLCAGALALTCSLFLLSACCVNPDTQEKRFEIDSSTLRVGIISDSQLVYDENGANEFQNNLIRSFSVLKERNADMIIFAGDITDKSNAKAYDLYVDAINTVFADSPPIIQSIMGNHDYWGNGTTGKCRKLFESKTHQSPWTHYIVNGYHFIGASPATGNMNNGYSGMEKWLRTQIDQAVGADPNKPVFVTTHNAAKDTVYGSDDWGDKKLYEIFKDYPQVVNISGHLHYSLLDERAIHQEDYTSITTQSVSYTEMEKGKVNGTIPPNASITPMGYYMEISSDKVEIQRLNFGNEFGAAVKEEKQNMRWTLPIPLNRDGFNYTADKRSAVNKAPEITADGARAYQENGKTYISFSAGIDDDFVHSYKLEWNDGQVQYYFSDFYNGISDMSKSVVLPIEHDKGTFSVKIYAVDSWNLTSSKYIAIDSVSVI